MSDNAEKLLVLDSLRGFAAIYVMVGHARILLWEGYSEGYLKHSEDYSALEKLQVYAFGIFNQGHAAVMLFFVLSGFLIHLNNSRLLEEKGFASFRLGSYLKKRARRILPPFYFSLLLTFVVGILGLKFELPLFRSASGIPFLDSIVGRDLSWKVLVNNLAFLMGTYGPAYGSNGPLWSLKYEVWFYIIYPFFLYLSSLRYWAPTVLISLLFLISRFLPELVSFDLLITILVAFPIWWFGVLLADSFVGRNKIALKSYALLLLSVFFIPLFNGWDRDIFTGLCFAGFISLLLTKQDWPAFRFLRHFAKLGDFSYTLYVIHFPILALLSGYLLKKGEGRLPAHFGWVFLGILISLVSSFFVHLVVERPFVRKRN